MQTLVEQLAAALEAVLTPCPPENHLVDADGVCPECDVEKQARLALDRHRAEPEHKCSMHPLRDCGFECPCYQAGANEGHSMGCNDDSCACWAAGFQKAIEADPETLLREAGQARRAEGERVMDGK